MTIDELEKAFYKAQCARTSAEAQRGGEKQNLLVAAEREIDAKMDAKHGARIEELRLTERVASDTLAAARIVAGNQKRMAFPAGIVLGWERRESFRFSRDYKWQLTGERGVYETVTADSKFSGSLSHYSIPKQGDIIVRLVRKDGTPGLLFKSLDRFRGTQWLPEGQAPQEAAKE